jgi:hypothetical protein
MIAIINRALCSRAMALFAVPIFIFTTLGLLSGCERRDVPGGHVIQAASAGSASAVVPEPAIAASAAFPHPA